MISPKQRVRRGAFADMDAIYLMGFEAWAEGQTKDAYLAACRASPKYANGIWYLLESSDGQLLSSLVTYEFGLFENKPVIGFGSIVTESSQRCQGYAGHLLQSLIAKLEANALSPIFYLWSDISPAYYERFGFTALPVKYQTKSGSSVMIRCSTATRDSCLKRADYQPPAYF